MANTDKAQDVAALIPTLINVASATAQVHGDKDNTYLQSLAVSVMATIINDQDKFNDLKEAISDIVYFLLTGEDVEKAHSHYL